MPHNKSFEPGDVAVATGMYRVFHQQHRLPHQVAVVRGDRFPRCAQCTDAVRFELFYAASFLASTYKDELPVIDDTSSSAASSS